MAGINLTIHLEYKEVVERLKAEDWVIPVRCKDCKYGEKDANAMYCLFDGASWHEPDYYCSYGERKGGVNDER